VRAFSSFSTLSLTHTPVCTPAAGLRKLESSNPPALLRHPGVLSSLCLRPLQRARPFAHVLVALRGGGRVAAGKAAVRGVNSAAAGSESHDDGAQIHGSSVPKKGKGMTAKSSGAGKRCRACVRECVHA